MEVLLSHTHSIVFAFACFDPKKSYYYSIVKDSSVDLGVQVKKFKKYKPWDPRGPALYKWLFGAALLLAPSVAQQLVRGQFKTITIQSRTLGFQDLYFLNFVTCNSKAVCTKIES